MVHFYFTTLGTLCNTFENTLGNEDGENTGSPLFTYVRYTFIHFETLWYL